MNTGADIVAGIVIGFVIGVYWSFVFYLIVKVRNARKEFERKLELTKNKDLIYAYKLWQKA